MMEHEIVKVSSRATDLSEYPLPLVTQLRENTEIAQ